MQLKTEISERKFQPVSITLTFETLQELQNMRALFGCNYTISKPVSEKNKLVLTQGTSTRNCFVETWNSFMMN
jgi:hypothetical protein